MRTIAIVASIVVLSATTTGRAQEAFDFPNHNLHNFFVSERTYIHAVAMGYRLVPSSNAVDRRVDGASVPLLPGESIARACFVNPWFSRTNEDALPSLRYDGESHTIKLTDSTELGRGIRIVTKLP